jgi:hypothetical protein
MMSISFSQLFPKSNPSSPLSWENTFQSPVLCSREKMFSVDAGPGTLIIRMWADLTRVSINVAYIIFRDGITHLKYAPQNQHRSPFHYGIFLPFIFECPDAWKNFLYLYFFTLASKQEYFSSYTRVSRLHSNAYEKENSDALLYINLYELTFPQRPFKHLSYLP